MMNCFQLSTFAFNFNVRRYSLEPTSPFAERFGQYVNRSVGRPLFVSALVYLNGPGKAVQVDPGLTPY